MEVRAEQGGAAPATSNVASPRRRRRPPSENNQQNQRNAVKDPLRIVVTGYPPYSQPQDLTRTFSRFGQATVEKITPKFAIVSFTNSYEAEDAVKASTKVNIYGEFLTVKLYSEQNAAEVKAKGSPKRDFSKTKLRDEIVKPKDIELHGSFSVQLQRLLAAVRLRQEDVAALAALYTDLELALQQQWPGCTAIPFGSITTGLGVRWSDADCFVSVPPAARRHHDNFVNRARRLLAHYPQVFAEILSIPRANTPIVKFFHVPTDTNCDLTFKTPLGAQNSKLIAFLLHADQRLIPMAVVIKYWAKVHELTGTGKLTNYALTMLIIFYLQQPPLSILPSIQWLQRNAADDVLVDYWNTGFSKDSLPPCSNTSSISELLGGFYEYYSAFNFEEMVVCPYLGYPVKKDVFSDVNLLPPEFQLYKNNVMTEAVYPIRINTFMCVQDPFEQCHNVASSVTGKLAEEIKAYFKFAADAYDKEKLNNCENFLQIILLQKPKIVRVKSHPEYRVNVFPRIIVTIIDTDWKPIIRNIVFTIFEKMLKIKLGKVEEKMNPDTRKEKEKYTGNVTKAIWKRKQYSRMTAVMNMDLREKQAKITEEILKVEKQVFSIQFQLTITFCHDPKSAVIAIKLGSGDLLAFREFGKFYISVMQNWLTTLLKPHARPSDKDTAAKIADTLKMVDLTQGSLETESEEETIESLVVTNSKVALAEPLP